ncbi:MAG: histone deacetylase [Solirubrobacterales bacterium]|nr:histone deacetylase [Solirubrobacterales bacterium]
MRVWSHADHPFPLPAGHRYPLGKYRLLRDLIVNDGTVRAADVLTPQAISWDTLHTVHDGAFLERMRDGTLDRRQAQVLGLPWSPELVERARRGTQGTLHAARDALDGQRVGLMLGGGTHHAGRASARGYCLFNDLAVVTGVLRAEGRAQRVLVVDCDVHQGDGTAELLGPGGGDHDAYTLSVQCERNYPGHRIPSHLDIELPAGTAGPEYLQALSDGLAVATRAFGTPDLVLYLAGADPWEGDGLGRLALTMDALRERDELVLDHCLALGAPVVVTLAGGYPPDVLDGVRINHQTVLAVRGRADHDAVLPPPLPAS